MRTNFMRVRNSARWSRNSVGGIHTSGSVPLRNSMPSPQASSLSVLFVLPMRFLASPALARCTWCPAASISSASQYQCPVASRAIGLLPGRLAKNCRYSSRSWLTRWVGPCWPSSFTATKTEYFLCASHPIYSFMPQLLFGQSLPTRVSYSRGCCGAFIRSQRKLWVSNQSDPSPRSGRHKGPCMSPATRAVIFIPGYPQLTLWAKLCRRLRRLKQLRNRGELQLLVILFPGARPAERAALANHLAFTTDALPARFADHPRRRLVSGELFGRDFHFHPGKFEQVVVRHFAISNHLLFILVGKMREQFPGPILGRLLRCYAQGSSICQIHKCRGHLSEVAKLQGPLAQAASGD